MIEYRVDILPPEGREILASLTLFMVSHPSEFSIWAVPKTAPEIELALTPIHYVVRTVIVRVVFVSACEALEFATNSKTFREAMMACLGSPLF